ncbi:hypothetical protein Tco_0044412 [Tanacetum coccineum]
MGRERELPREYLDCWSAKRADHDRPPAVGPDADSGVHHVGLLHKHLEWAGSGIIGPGVLFGPDVNVSSRASTSLQNLIDIDVAGFLPGGVNKGKNNDVKST